jgi:uncharacterized protein (TIGR02453 family)
MVRKQKVIDFPRSAAGFMAKLARNNNREWFEAHREDYETEVYIPAQMFINELGERLKSVSPGIIAVPKTDKSIFRIYRDVRFSKDKSPYKTNLGIFLWEGSGKKMECSGFYMHIEPKSFFIGIGIYMFTELQIKKFRELVSAEFRAAELGSIISRIEKKGYTFGGKTLKKTPRGYDKDYEYAHLYHYTGFYAGYESSDMSEIYDDDLTDYCFRKFKDLLPLHRWLVDNIAS